MKTALFITDSRGSSSCLNCNGLWFNVTAQILVCYFATFLWLDVMLPQMCLNPVVTFIFRFMAEGVKTASGMIDYDGPAERDITFILFASQ